MNTHLVVDKTALSVVKQRLPNATIGETLPAVAVNSHDCGCCPGAPLAEAVRVVVPGKMSRNQLTGLLGKSAQVRGVKIQ